MEDVKSLKLCGIGMLITFSSVVLFLVPFIGTLAPIAGLIVLLVGYNKVSQELGQPEIWSNILKWFLIILIGGIVVSIVAGVLIAISAGSILQNIDDISSIGDEESIQIFENLIPIIIKLSGVIAIVLGLFYIVMIISTIFFYKANKIIGEILGANSFILASRLILWGAILTIIIVGAILSLIGAIILTVAFFGSYKKK